MNAPANISIVYVLDLPDDDREIAALHRQVRFFADLYQRRVWPTLIASASILGAVVIVAQVARWIAR